MSINFERSLALVQAAAHDYGMKELSGYLNKGVSTLYAELNQTDGYKFGVKDFFKTIHKIGIYAALEAILADMGMAIYYLPLPREKISLTIPSIIESLANANKGSSEAFNESLKTIQDGKVTRKEAILNINKWNEALNTIVQLRAQYMEIKNNPPADE